MPTTPATRKRTTKRKAATKRAAPRPRYDGKTWTPRKGFALMMRTCAPGGLSYGDFKWPLKAGAVVKAPDWNPKPHCGNGLHGLLWGYGSADLLSWTDDAIWIAAEVELATVVELTDNGQIKVKVPRATIVAVGSRVDVANLIGQHAPKGSVVHGCTATAGARGTATAGYAGTATAGDGGTATAGTRGTATAGATGTATAGDDGTIQIKTWDGAASRYRIVTGYVGENGIKPNVKYRLDGKGQFVEVSP
jgi:hypothetical protein